MELKTNEALLQALHKAAARKPSAEELQQQRISFIYGSIKESSGITKSRIQDLLAEQLGR